MLVKVTKVQVVLPLVPMLGRELKVPVQLLLVFGRDKITKIQVQLLLGILQDLRHRVLALSQLVTLLHRQTRDMAQLLLVV
jgi:hypothetical protein